MALAAELFYTVLCQPSESAAVSSVAEFSGTVGAWEGEGRLSARRVAEVQDLCFPLALGNTWKE